MIAMAHVVTHKLKNAFEGALAGGGDPATSPLYVFGPFLKLIVVGGVALVTFGGSIWLVLLTIAMVSAMYRLVMAWVTDGSGGSGLSEEEFGGWAVKINAAITFVEYTLTFLVSMAAMVTFIADRFPILNEKFLFVQYRVFVAIGLSVLTGWLVNRGPRTAARIFGPATFAVLALLWAMILATILQMDKVSAAFAAKGIALSDVTFGLMLGKAGIQLPVVHWQAFRGEYLYEFTLGGYARMLAVMTGIEVFANLVAAYDGNAAQKSKKAFGSLLIIMGSTGLTMLIVGPAIFAFSDPTDPYVSVFTQTMDALLPDPLPYIGTIVGVAVLLSASAASAQGLQNLALGLKSRRYIPAFIGQINRFEVAPAPVWIEVGLVSLIFLLFGTHEETYLAIYAAGVFILLSMTSWAVIKRLLRQMRGNATPSRIALVTGVTVAAVLTTGATVIIFEERFFEGAWTYFLFIPVLYAVFTYYRRKLGPPSPVSEELGRLEEAMMGGFGLGQSTVEVRSARPPALTDSAEAILKNAAPRPLPPEKYTIRHLLIPLDGSLSAEYALPAARAFASAFDARLTLLSILPEKKMSIAASTQPLEAYLASLAEPLRARQVDVQTRVIVGPIVRSIIAATEEMHADVVVITTTGGGGMGDWLMGGIAQKIISLTRRPLLIVQPGEQKPLPLPPPQIRRILIPLDGSEIAERALSHGRGLSQTFNAEVVLLSVPEVPEVRTYGIMADVVADLRSRAEEEAIRYLGSIAAALRQDGLTVEVVVVGSHPARTIVSVAEAVSADLILLTSHGAGAGADRLFIGSVAARVIRYSRHLVYLVPIYKQFSLT